MRSPNRSVEEKDISHLPRFYDQSFIDCLYEGIIVFNNRGQMIVCNKAVERIFNTTAEELKNLSATDPSFKTIREDGSPFPLEEHPSVYTLKTGLPQRNVIMGVHKPDGDISWISINSQAGFCPDSDQLEFVTCSFKDITLEKKLLLETLARKREIVKAIIGAQEKERKEISYELHDNVSQLLATCRLYVEAAGRTDDNADLLYECKELLTSAIDEIRNLSHNLTPAAFEEKGLFTAVMEMVEKINGVSKAPITLIAPSCNNLETLLQPDMKTAIFRIIQEQLNNTLKHARATQIYIKFERGDKQLFLEIGDDGVGFDMAKIKRGLGINNIQSRVSLFGGEMDLESVPGKGCTLKVTLPLNT
jgi:signal transduction histidine kinase